MGIFLLSGASLGPAAWASVPATAAQLAQAPAFEVSITGYNAVPGQTDGSPDITASGAYSNPEIIAARSPDLAAELPFGTVIAIVPTDTSDPNCGYPLVANRIGFRVIEDSMNPKMHDKVDILFGTNDMVNLGDRLVNAANALGICSNVKVVVVGHIDLSALPRTQTELAQAITGTGAALAVAN